MTNIQKFTIHTPVKKSGIFSIRYSADLANISNSIKILFVTGPRMDLVSRINRAGGIFPFREVCKRLAISKLQKTPLP